MMTNDKILILEADCGCHVEKQFRVNRLPLYVIVGQQTGITENPFAAGANSDVYMAQTALAANCQHREGAAS